MMAILQKNLKKRCNMEFIELQNLIKEKVFHCQTFYQISINDLDNIKLFLK